MKKQLVIIAIFNCAWLFAQHNFKSSYRAGLKLGYSRHTLTGNFTKSRPAGDLVGGLWFQLKMNKQWTAQTELLLLDKGIGGSRASLNPHRISLYYFEIPVLFQFHRKKMYYEFGPGLGYMLNHFESLYGISSPEQTDKHPFIRRELSFNVGTGCTLNDYWTIGFRFSHSLLPVRGAVPLVSEKTYNRLFALSLTRQLKKKKAGDQKEE